MTDPATGPRTRTSDSGEDGDAVADAAVEEEPLPPFAEQLADQLGGRRGLLESGIPVAVFVVANLGFEALFRAYPQDDPRTGLKWAIGVAVATAVGMAVTRLARGRPVRHAVNGLFGIALGAWLAWDSGEARDFYLPGILWNVAYAVGMVVSVAVRQPLVGWFWSVIANKGRGDWREDRRLLRTFGWLTWLWAGVFAAKAAIQSALWAAHADIALGVARIALGYPVFLLLLTVSFWAVRRVRPHLEPA